MFGVCVLHCLLRCCPAADLMTAPAGSQDLVQQLLWDVSWTAVAPTLWANNARNETDGVMGRFLITDGGLTRFHPADR